MFTITVIEKTHPNVMKISINNYEFTIGSSLLKKIDTLEEWLKNVQCILKRGKLNCLHSYFQNYSPFYFNCMATLFPQEFKQYVFHICDYFIQNKIKITPARITIFIVTNDLNQCLLGKSIVSDIRSIFIPIIEKYIIYTFSSAFKNNDTKTVWRASPMFYQVQLAELVKLNKELSNVFEKYLKFCGETFKKEHRLASPHTLANYALYGTKLAEPINSLTKHFPILNTISVDIYNSLRESSKTYRFEDDLWILNTKNLDGFNSHRFNFSSYPEQIKIEIKTYINYLLKHTEKTTKAIYRIQLSLNAIIKEFTTLPYENINSLLHLNYFHIVHLINHLQQVTKSNGKNKYTYTSVYHMSSKLKMLLDFLIEHYNLEIDNPLRKYKFKNVNSTSSNVSYIPENIIIQLEDKLIHAPLSIQNAWTILINTGMRFSDLQLLEEDCIQFNEKINMYVLRYATPKLQQNRINQGLSKYHVIPVNQAVVDAVAKQKTHTEELRVIANTNHLFITTNNFAVVLMSGTPFATTINNICKKYKIKDADNKIFHYSNHMCRKTLVMDLLTQGMSIEQTADFIGHMTPATTRKYYSAIDHKKIAELDNKMWGKLFTQSLPNEIQDQYSEAEKSSLFKEFQLGSRETPEGHGVCSKHISFGPCKKKSCVGCKMLITGPQKLSKWENLYTEQLDYILELEKQFLQADIHNFSEYRSYQQEINLLNLYKDTIKQIKKFAKRNGISIET
ncbi:site-specific integrase [Bacillus wiedmannii]|uniref:tyrosine-type recombinase/integrase n=1 Tax=Bacillus wiedmannii TaxID=1890302 RepID=UPI0010BF0E9A|nr:site-specific integrase [Bacillus wiedmannii]TKI15430.1 site-specific integrase [Bacillus wiedmannii]